MSIKVNYLNREWEVNRYQWPSGTAAILLTNRDTGGVLPASLEVTRLPGSPNEAHVLEEFVKPLTDAGIIKATAVAGRWMGMSMQKCLVIHRELMRSEYREPQTEREEDVIDDLAYELADGLVEALWPDARGGYRECLICNVQVLIYERLEEFEACVRTGMMEWMTEPGSN